MLVHRTSRLAVLTALTAALALAGTGCSLIAPDSPAEEVRRAFVDTVAAGPASVSVSSRAAIGGTDVAVTGDGVVDVAGQAADLTLQLPTLGRVRTVVLGDVAYAEVPPLFSMFAPGGRPWASIDLNRLSELSLGSSLAVLRGSSNPFEQLRYLEGIRDDAREIGREPVAGVETTRYAATIDLDRTPAAQDPATRPAVDRLRTVLGTAALPVEVWVDDDGRIRQARQTVTPGAGSGAAGAGAGGATTTTVVLHAFGVPAAISAPRPDEVTDLAALLPG